MASGCSSFQKHSRWYADSMDQTTDYMSSFEENGEKGKTLEILNIWKSAFAINNNYQYENVHINRLQSLVCSSDHQV